MFFLYIKNNKAKVLDKSRPSFAKDSHKYLNWGYESVGDFVSEERAKEYALVHYEAYTHEDAPYGMCRLCGLSPAHGLIQGRYFEPLIHQAPLPYKGYVCEDCGLTIENGRWEKKSGLPVDENRD